MATGRENIVRMLSSTTGTGSPITLGAAVTGFKSLPASADGKTFRYTIHDGANREVTSGVYTHAGTTITRVTISSTNADSPISLSGTQEISFGPTAEDFALGTASEPGLFEKATDAELRAATADKGLTADLIESASALVALADAAPVAVDWDSGINFSLTVTASRQIDNPTSGQPGTYRTILVQGNDGTDRTITFDTEFLGTVPTITDCDSGKWYLLTIRCITASHFVVSSQVAKT